MSSFVGAIAIADLVKTTLGPKGMDKILQSVRAGNLIDILLAYAYQDTLIAYPVSHALFLTCDLSTRRWESERTI
jgi:hypothetical protein